MMTGNEVWRLNMHLAHAVESFADPEDSKKSRRKSPTLQQKLHKVWNGTYAEKLERDLAKARPPENDVPSYIYEPPKLRDEPPESDGDEEQLAPQPGPAKPAPGLGPRAKAGSKAAPPGSMTGASDDGQADGVGPSAIAGKPAAKSRAPAKGAGRKAAGQGAGKAAARAAAEPQNTGTAAAQQDRAERQCSGLAEREGAVDMDCGEAGPGPSTEAHRQGENLQAQRPQRRSERKATTAPAEPGTATKAQPRQNARGATAAKPGARTAEVDPDELGLGLGAAAEPAPSVPRGGRKGQPPSHVAFGSGAARPTSAAGAQQQQLQPQQLSPIADDDAEDCDAAGGGPGAVGMTTHKRSRESLPLTDLTRSQKVLRLEEQQQHQQAAQVESLKQRLKELEQKNKEQAELIKQKDAATKAAERRCAQLEKNLEAASQERERLKSERDAKAAENAELKVRVRESKTRAAEVAQQWAEITRLHQSMGPKVEQLTKVAQC